MGLSASWRASRLRRRFMSEAAVIKEEIADDRVPDATVDEVGVPGENEGFDGHPLPSRGRSGYGTGDPGGPGWAGWGA